MSVPTYDKFIEPILRFLAQHSKPVPAKLAHEAAAKALSLTDEDRAEFLGTSVKGIQSSMLNLPPGNSLSCARRTMLACRSSIHDVTIFGIEPN
jgi:restriction endonuclease Mrr